MRFESFVYTLLHTFHPTRSPQIEKFGCFYQSHQMCPRVMEKMPESGDHVLFLFLDDPLTVCDRILRNNRLKSLILPRKYANLRKLYVFSFSGNVLFFPLKRFVYTRDSYILWLLAFKAARIEINSYVPMTRLSEFRGS